MANTKAKIIMGVGITAVAGITAWIITSAVRKNKIKKKIYNALNDTKTVEGQQGALPREDKHKALVGFDPLFWRDGKNGIMPDTNKLFRSQDAREVARKINDAIWDNDWFGATEDEETVMGQIKSLETQGQLSQVAYAYARAKLGSGRENSDLAEDIKTALEGGWFSKDYLDELNKEVENKPY
jgi:hypothetical protein